jgi:Mannosyltransferase (PIG-V)
LPARSEAVRGAGTVVLAYVAMVGALLAVAALDGYLRHHSFTRELANWDGKWYRLLAEQGYPNRPLHAQSTLGFFPLYAVLMSGLSHVLGISVVAAGVMLAAAGGLVATLLVQRLATGWWGPDVGFRAALLFCLSPGAVVFVMVYSEGLMLALAAGCILALERRQWLLGGSLAGIATALEPTALALIVVCAFSAARQRGWRPWAAPLLSLTGVASFAAYLWARTGTPFASYYSQHYGWQERTDPLATVHHVVHLTNQISFTHFNDPTINLNDLIGVVGTIVLLLGLLALALRGRGISFEAVVWTGGISFLALTSEYVPPNPRLLLTGFPAIIVFTRLLRGARFAVLLVASAAALAGLSALTFIGPTLRP